MAGLDFFGIDETPRPEPTRRPQQKAPESVLDDDKLMDELKGLSTGIKSIDKGLMKKIEEVKKRQDALAAALKPVNQEMEHLKKLLLDQLLASGASSIKSDTGVNFIRVKRVNFSMENAKERVKFIRRIGREDLLTVTAPDFNKLCKDFEKEGKDLPKIVRKSEAYTLTVRGA